MNDRIKELAEKAEEVVFYSPSTGKETKEVNLERFAELLLQECLLAISKTPKLFTEEEVAAMVKCHDQVEKHFGVEE